MGVNQSVFSTTPGVGFAGMRANTELDNTISRTLESAAGCAFGQPLFRGSDDHGCVIGGTFAATGAGSEGAGNIGTGVITDAPAVATGAKAGRYVIQLLATSATAAFRVEDPDGAYVGEGNVATEFVGGGLTFTISNAGTMTIGDAFYVDVTYTANAGFLGIAVADPIVPALASAPDAYPQYYTASILNQGVIWVTAGAGGVTDGGQAYWNPATLKYTAATGILLPGCYYDTTAAADALVRLAVRERALPN